MNYITCVCFIYILYYLYFKVSYKPIVNKIVYVLQLLLAIDVGKML